MINDQREIPKPKYTTKNRHYKYTKTRPELPGVNLSATTPLTNGVLPHVKRPLYCSFVKY